jgi:uncharacterized membrane protein
MLEFSAALATFLAAHSLPAMPGAKVRLVATLGSRGYTLAYSALSIALLVWVIAAARRAPYVPLWDPSPWQWHFTIALMPFAFILLILGAAQPNPLSIAFRRSGEPGGVIAVTRHPILWSFALWAIAHIPANGDLVLLVLFGAMAAFALLGMRLADRRARRRLGEARWRMLAAKTSTLPFAALVAGRTQLRSSNAAIGWIALALALYAWFLLDGHARLIGVDPWVVVAW